MTAHELIIEFLQIQNDYSFTKRKLITADRYVHVAHQGLISKSDYDNPALTEPLVEHVGHLPVIASFFYPYLEHEKVIDLGKVLIMLSIHDIGELKNGDVFAYDKTESDSKIEYDAALSLLHPSYHPIFIEYEDGVTLEAKYARSVDVLAPIIHEVDMPYFTLDRFTKMGAAIEDVIERKRKYMLWNPFLLTVFDMLIEQYMRARDGRELLFKAEDWDLNV